MKRSNFTLLLTFGILLFGSCDNNSTEDNCTASVWYQDSDNDGLGNPDVTQSACEQPEGYVSNSNDTDDTGGSGSSNCDTPAEVAQSTNSEIEAMRQAMLAFRNSLSSSLLSEASTCLDNERFYTWHNTPNSNGTQRDGIIYGDLSEEQLDLFKTVLKLFLSDGGYQKVDEITMLAEGLLETENPTAWSPDYYSIDLFGDPENSGSWGFQLDGHHLAINFLVHGDNVSMVPAFLGGEPAVSSFNGTDFDIFKDERDLALTLYSGLTSTEIEDAVSSGSHAMEVGPASTPGDVDPYRGDYDYSGFAGTGVKYTDMSTATQANLILVMKEYVYNMETTFADAWWTDIMNNIDDTYFVWIDEVDQPSTTSPFYYRIYNPYVWIEYNAENALGGGGADYNHVHTITRIPSNPTTTNGGDYGVFAQVINKGGVSTLYEHYAMADHHQMSEMLFDYEVELPHHNHHHHHHSHHTHVH
ncbi:DUF3500 domain-containing protein [Flammeovirga aprica]|uniref:DUF3500 domain-containing protein n=1 Tax=Flammeovirga aprica JL-4 TaxID=694437 RepID=A0A7X9RY02_9BACT|nr:DUF3500 domain-containing protein [Flammeovirga aprica]NME70744.1 DUF3500 domain-containing protein [Flammeovirga aprica JL-4]